MANPKKIKARYAAERSSRAKWKHVRFKDNRLPETRGEALSAGGCWCGEPYNHEWSGKDAGKPHPVTSGRGIIRTPPHVLRREATLELQKAGVCPACRGYPQLRKSPVTDEDEPWCNTCLGTGDFPPPSPRVSRKQRLDEMVDRLAIEEKDDPPECGTLWVPLQGEVETPVETEKTEKKAELMTAQRYENDEEAVAALATALLRLPDNWIECRDMRHAWKLHQDFHVENSEPGTRVLTNIGRTLKCIRCETRRVEHYITRSGIGLEKVKQYYQYPEGYQMHGVPRGVKPQSIVQEEQYRRAMERFADQAREAGFHAEEEAAQEGVIDAS